MTRTIATKNRERAVALLSLAQDHRTKKKEDRTPAIFAVHSDAAKYRQLLVTTQHSQLISRISNRYVKLLEMSLTHTKQKVSAISNRYKMRIPAKSIIVFLHRCTALFIDENSSRKYFAAGLI